MLSNIQSDLKTIKYVYNSMWNQTFKSIDGSIFDYGINTYDV